MSTQPSPSRLRRARLGGVRPDSAWLSAGLACVALAAQLRWGGGSAAEMVEGVAAALRDPGVDPALARGAVRGALELGLAVLVRLAVVMVGAGLVAAALLGRVGPVQPAAARALGIAPTPARLRVALAGTIVLGVVLAIDLQRRIAGGARSADASGDALVVLWQHGGSATLFAAGAAMIVAGAIEALQMRRDQHEAIRPTPEQAADEARRSGGRRA